jgi:hypothetical protein
VETALPPGTEWKELSVSDGVAHVRLSDALSDEALAQVVYTLTQFPSVRAVEIGGRRLTRPDRGTFEFTQPFSLACGGLGKLVVLERSAADGARLNVVETPILM